MVKKNFNEAAERAVGTRIKIHGGKLVAVVVDAVSATSVRIDYDGLLDPNDKRTRMTGRKLITLDELSRPELITVGQWKHLSESSRPTTHQ